MPSRPEPDEQTLKALERLEADWEATKPPDENAKKRAQKGAYEPGQGFVQYSPLSAPCGVSSKQTAAHRKMRKAGPPALEPPPAELAPRVIFPHYGWRKIHTAMPPCLRGSWQLLSWQARMLYRELCLHCDDDGVIQLGTVGLEAVRGLLMAQNPDDWKQIEPALRELINRDWLVWFEDEPHRVTVAWFRESQDTARSEEAERKARYRAAHGTRPGLSRDCPGTVPPLSPIGTGFPTRKGMGLRQASRDRAGAH